ncbi:MAG: HDIG domain-containing protein [Clostridiales bacterium]|nr:HDIG domain-containing protein [Clostridiales bacterium]
MENNITKEEREVFPAVTNEEAPLQERPSEGGVIAADELTPKRKDRIKRAAKKLPTAWSLIMLGLTCAAVIAVAVLFMHDLGIDYTRMAGSGVAILIGFAVFGLYLVLRRREAAGSLRRMLFICVALLAAALPMPITMRINPGFMTFTLAALLLSLLADEKVAMLSVLPVAITAGAVASAMESPEGVQAAVMLTVIVSGLVAVFALNIRKTRSSTVIAGGLAGIAGVVICAAVMFACGQLFDNYWQMLLWILGSCLVCGILAVGLMPLFEWLFDIPSEARLNELLNNNHPLIKRLMTEAPGTYHHSLIVASLAEAAAEEIGANALLCRVCACYHDVGKLRCPQCFKENQLHGRNMHDDLDPYESAKRIIAHQKDGVTLLEKSKMPGDVVRIVGEHHGDSVMVYFYDKAKKLAPEGTQVDESLFRYPSRKPSSKESAILMLADCCEAAVRSMQNPNMKDIENKVREVIAHKWDKHDSMLWDSPLTFIDIKKIEDSFIRTFSAFYHERVEYPDLEEIDVR